jgi:hypothetical protein
MLNMNASRIAESGSFALSAAVTSVREGAALIGVMEGGSLVAKETAGGNAEVFLGFAAAQIATVTEAPKVEEVTIPASGPFTVTLAKTPLAPATRVGVQVINAAGEVTATFAWDANATLAAGEFIISGNVITFHTDDASKRVRITYVYAPTVTEARMIYGQGVGDGAQSVIGAVGVIRRAPVLFTDMYDSSDNWAAGGKVYTAAGGKVSLKNAGTLLPGVTVLQAPSIANGGLLGLVVSV